MADLQSVQPEQSENGSAAGNALEYRIYDSFEKARCLRSEWNELATRTGDLLCSYDWCEIWWRHFGRWRRLEIHTLRDGPRLLAVLPLFHETIRPGGVWLRTVRVLGCDYTIGTVGLAIEPACARQFTHMVLAELDRRGAWDILQIAPLRSYCDTVEPIATACADAANVQAVILGRQDNWCTLFHLPGTFDEFLASLPKKVRSEIHRRERRLHERYRVEVEVATKPEQVAPALEALIRLHQKRWMDKGHPGQLRDRAVQQFHRDLAQRLVATGQLVLMTLKLDGQIVSVSYGYRFGTRIHGLFVGHCYDLRWLQYGLGRIMYCHLIRYAIAQGSSVVESGRGVFQHKLQLGGHLYGERSLVVARRGWGTRLRFWLALRMAYPVHVLYSRVWTDMIASRFRLRPGSRHFYIRNNALLQILRRTRFRLFGGPKVLEARCLEARPRSLQDGSDSQPAGTDRYRR